MLGRLFIFGLMSLVAASTTPLIAQCQCCCSVAKSRRCATGAHSDDLKIHVEGRRYSIVEAFFKSEKYVRIELPQTSDLACGTDIKLAKANEFGTFAIRYGKRRDRFQVFAWKTGSAQPQRTNEIVLEAGYPVSLEWVSSRILKVKFGHEMQKEYVLRFNDADAPDVWTGLFQTDAPNSPYDPDGP